MPEFAVINIRLALDPFGQLIFFFFFPTAVKDECHIKH